MPACNGTGEPQAVLAALYHRHKLRHRLTALRLGFP
jgi:hypothetical protein